MNRRQIILRRAAELFAQNGVAQTSMEDIATAAGIKREGIYYYFKGRSDILLQIILPSSRSLLTNLSRLVNSNLPSPEKLRAAIENHLDAFNPSYIEMSLALREHHFDEQDDFSELKTIWTEYDELWFRLIRDGQTQGFFKSELDAKMVAFGLLGMCNWVARWYDPNREASITQITETFADLAASGINTPSANRYREFAAASATKEATP